MKPALETLLRSLHGDDSQDDGDPGVGAAAGLPGDATLVAALDALGELGDPAAVEPIRVVLAVTKTFPSDVHRAAIRALGRIGAPEAVECLLNVVAEPEEEEDSQAEARIALRALGPAAVEPLIVALKGAWDTNDRIAAIRALGAIGGPAACVALFRELTHAEDDLLVAVAEAIQEGGDRDAVYALGDRLHTVIARDLYGGEALVRAITKHGGKHATEPLIEALDAGILLAATPLAEAGHRRAVPSVVWWVESGDAENQTLFRALGLLGDPRGVLPLAHRSEGIPARSGRLRGVVREDRSVAREELERLCGALGQPIDALVTIHRGVGDDGGGETTVSATTRLTDLCRLAEVADSDSDDGGDGV